MRAQPGGELAHHGVAPQPGRETFEVVEGGVERVVALAEQVAVEPLHVGPVAFDGDRVEALLLDQAPGDGRAHGVELAGAVAGLAQQDEVAAGGHRQQRVVVAVVAVQADRGGAQGIRAGKRIGHGGPPSPLP